MNPKVRYSRKCKCGNLFHTGKTSDRKFCSVECGRKWQGRRERRLEVELVCNYCGKNYKVPHWRKRSSRFCSQKCDIFSRQTPDTDLSRLKFHATRVGVKLSPQVRRARSQFFEHRHSAGTRGIEFELTFDQWWNIWLESGHWQDRGRHKGDYVMARFADKGPYAVGNVKIVKAETNSREKEALRGSKNGATKLTEDDVREIRRLDGKIKRRLIAEKYGINYWHVRDIQKGRGPAWSWLE